MYIAVGLRRAGRTVACVDEGDANHPADLPDYDIFDGFAAECDAILATWRRFVHHAQPGTTYVFNCLPLQNPMCETMMRFGMDEEQSRDYIARIADIIEPMEPLVVYLDDPDVRTTVDRVLDERGNDWLEAVAAYHVRQGLWTGTRPAGIRRIHRLPGGTQASGTTHPAILAPGLIDTLAGPRRGRVPQAVRQRRMDGEAIALAGLLSDHAMHASLTELVVAPSWRHRCVGGCLLRHVERYAANSLQEGWEICADLRSSKDAEDFYGRHGYTAMPTAADGSGMERMLTR